MISVGWEKQDNHLFIWQFDGAWTVAECQAAMSRSIIKLRKAPQPVRVLLDMRASAPPQELNWKRLMRQRFTPALTRDMIDVVVIVGPVAQWEDVLARLENALGPAPVPITVVESMDAATAWLRRRKAAQV